MPKRGRVIELICPKCGKKCGNQGSMRRHMMTHDKKPESPSLLRFFKKAPPSKFAVELKPIARKQKPKQIKLAAKRRPQRVSSGPIDVKSSSRPPPPRRPRTKPNVDMVHYMAPPDLTGPNLNKKSPQFRLVHVRYFEKLKEEKYPFLDKTMYLIKLRFPNFFWALEKTDFYFFVSVFACVPLQ